MLNLRTFAQVTVALTAVLAIFCPSFAAEELDPAWLVLQLPTNSSARRNVDLEKKLVDLGPLALPALERELRLGITSRQRQELSKANGSRRAAAASVLTRIPGDTSTDLLVRSLSDPPDNYGMTVEILDSLKKRTLSENQVVALLTNQEPMIVFAGMDHKDSKTSVPEIKAALERLFDEEAAKAQFRNEHGASLANTDALWEVHFAAGKLLKKDMLAEMRIRAGKVLAELQQEALHPTNPDEPVFISDQSRAEQILCGCLNKLHSLGEPVKDLVEDAARNAQGNQAMVLDMALARLGDRTRIAKVADHLTAADSPTMRYCAAVTLHFLREKFTLPALRNALRDPYRRAEGSCVKLGDGMVYPVRKVAAGALKTLGEDPKKLQAEIKK